MAARLFLVLLSLATAYGLESCPAKKIGCKKYSVVKDNLIHSGAQEHWDTEHENGHRVDWVKFKEFVHKAVCQCEKAAAEKGFKYFALRNFAECHGLNSAEELDNSIYCFNHGFEQCAANEERCVGAEEGAFVFEVMSQKKPEFIESAVKHSVFCEHRGVRRITCPDNHVIDIKEGDYGRKSSRYCGYRRNFNLRCSAGLLAFQKIKNTCNGKQSCGLNPHNYHYGDPCKYTVKYLEIKHTCIRQPEGDSTAMRLHTSHFCEHAGSRSIDCGAGKLIKVRSGFYGRLAKVCGTGKTYRCVAGTSEAKMKTACDGKQKCTLNPHNAVYGDPCKYTRKYIEVNYACYKA